MFNCVSSLFITSRAFPMIFKRLLPAIQLVTLGVSIAALHAEPTSKPETAAQTFPLRSVRLLDGPFTAAVKANREYILDLDPDRLLAPFRREAGLEPRKPSYGNWESGGLDGHTAGHYLAALANMIASGNDPDGQLAKRLDYMLDELAICQNANGDGYIGGIPAARNSGRRWRQEISTR